MSQENKSGDRSKITFLGNSNFILIAVIVFALLLVVVPVLLLGCQKGGAADNNSELNDSPDTGKIISGTYSLQIDNAGSSSYIFDGNKVTNIYNGNSVEYTYVIAVENGVEVIKLTSIGEDGSSKTTTHEFYEGSIGEKNFISINDSYYYLQKNAE